MLAIINYICIIQQDIEWYIPTKNFGCTLQISGFQLFMSLQYLGRLVFVVTYLEIGLPLWLSGKQSACSGRDTGYTGSLHELGRSPGGRSGNPFQYSCWKTSIDRGAQQTTVHGVRKSCTVEVTEYACTWKLICIFQEDSECVSTVIH